jgi:uncharacterized damage-inducible protein DinB
MPGWIAQTLRDPHIDLGSGPDYSFESIETLLGIFDENVAEARSALREVQGPPLEEAWSLRAGGEVLFTQPRGAMVRNHLSHLVHHRGQLTVYLRLLDVPLPSIYGPTADKRG